MASVKLQRSQSAVQSPMKRPPTAAIRPLTASRPRRPYSAYTQRGAEEQGQRFDAPETNREWWRHYVKETPSPGTYSLGDFVDDLRKKNTTYGFRNTGRRPNSATAFAPSGGTLLPGAYEHKDFLEHSFKRPMAYSFRTIDRDSGPKIGHGYGDKEMSTSPAWFDLRAAEAAVIAKEANVTDSNFKSRVNRFPSPAFPILEGPGPGQYEPQKTLYPPPTVSSSFRSKTPRFNIRSQKVPGPGTYNTGFSDFGDPRPLPAVVHHIRKKHGIAIT